jgi:hypothetical protein
MMLELAGPVADEETGTSVPYTAADRRAARHPTARTARAKPRQPAQRGITDRRLEELLDRHPVVRARGLLELDDRLATHRAGSPRLRWCTPVLLVSGCRRRASVACSAFPYVQPAVGARLLTEVGVMVTDLWKRD